MSSRSNTPFHVATTALAAAALTLLAACGGGGDDPPRAPDVAITLDGSVQAVDRLGMRSYFGIPFAAPPTGNLRWAPPAAAAKWTTALNKTASAAPCLQSSGSPFRLPLATEAAGLPAPSEDCLYLDVHAPTGNGPFPVMVWFHGGAFNTGGTRTYADPSPLVSKGVIVVTVAYRMGAMGFLGHPALKDANGNVGNYGIMDQQAALRWVQSNITAFAGDPNNVTIFGESAGAFSVQTHLASPMSKGLFQKAIVESGGYGFDRQPTQAALETASTTIVTNALTDAGVTCTTVDAACLRGLSTTGINALLARFTGTYSSPVPTISANAQGVLPKSIKATFAAGENNKVPLIVGSNENEWSLFLAIPEQARRTAANNFDLTNYTFLSTSSGTTLTAANYSAVLSATAGGQITAANMATAYPLTGFGGAADPLAPARATTAQGTDFIFSCPTLNFAKRAQGAGQAQPVFMYEFRDQSAIPSIGIDANGNSLVSIEQGAAHSYEIQYLFNFRDLKNQERKDLQTAMSTYWTNFAKSSNPNTGNTVVTTWPNFAGNGSTDVLGLDVASGGGVKVLSTYAQPVNFDTQHQCSSLYGTALTF